LEFLRRIRNRAAEGAKGLRLGIGDDCALLGLRPGEEMAVTTDLSVAGQHFRLDWHPAEAVGHKTLARGLSDLAAMGARPVAAFLSLGLPRELTRAKGRQAAWVDGFFDGLLALAAEYDVPLAGGDLAESATAVADIVLVGAVRRGRALLRGGARAGDALYVTGALGGAAAGLERQAERGGTARRVPPEMAQLVSRHMYPQPRVEQGLWLARRGAASAAIDLSDGLSTDLAHICEESGVAAEVDAKALPVSAGATLEQALNGGEDYELLFTADEGARLPRAIGGVAVTRVGRVVRVRKGRPRMALLSGGKKQALEPRGWEHFA
jgi:thiamine-monophosphate kinase